jgi:hypothetical protein
MLVPDELALRARARAGCPAMITERFAAQLLSGEPASSAVDVTRRLLAVQGQDPRGVRLAIRVRSIGLTAADVDRALTTDRSILITWLNRGTLHLICAEDYWWLHALTTPPLLTASSRRLAQEGVLPADADKAVAVIEAALAADGPLTRGQLRERIAAAGVRTEGQALVHLLFLASQRAGIVRGPIVGDEHAFVLTRDWLGAPPAPLDRGAALAELARRYLAGHGPADDRDLAKWAGLPLRDARRGLAAIASELGDRDDGLADLARRPRSTPPALAPAAAPPRPAASSAAGPSAAPGPPDPDAALPPPRLFGAFDPLLLGWASREPIVGAHQGIVAVNGLFRPFALIRGKAVAIWTLSGGKITLTPLTRIAAADEAALMADADDVLRFLTEAPPRPSRSAKGRRPKNTA